MLTSPGRKRTLAGVGRDEDRDPGRAFTVALFVVARIVPFAVKEVNGSCGSEVRLWNLTQESGMHA
jgi:hypothetical protein